MAIRTEYHADTAIKSVRLLATVQQTANLKQSLDFDMDHNIKKFIIDLSECEFFDSAFIGLLVVTLKKLQKNDGNLKIIKPKNVFQFLLQSIAGSKIFEMYDSVEEALESFGFTKTLQPLKPINFIAA